MRGWAGFSRMYGVVLTVYFAVLAGLVRASNRSAYTRLLCADTLLSAYPSSYRSLQPHSPRMIISKQNRLVIYENLFKGACILSVFIII